MSRTNIDLVLRATEAGYRRPKPDFDTINALFHADHVLVSAWTTAFGEPEVKGGHGYRRWLKETEASLAWKGSIDGAIDVGPDLVLLAATLTVAGASSGVEGEVRIWCVYTVHDGKIIRTEVYTDSQAALEAAASALRR